jgi:enamine deaminase RidA (YjgF/YER057c/UK114 family)
MKKIINPVPGALLHDPNRVGGWHHAAIRAGDFIFLSGVVGAYPGTRTLAPTVEQIRLIFKHQGRPRGPWRPPEDIVRTNLYFTDRKTSGPSSTGSRDCCPGSPTSTKSA